VSPSKAREPPKPAAPGLRRSVWTQEPKTEQSKIKTPAEPLIAAREEEERATGEPKEVPEEGVRTSVSMQVREEQSKTYASFPFVSPTSTVVPETEVEPPNQSPCCAKLPWKLSVMGVSAWLLVQRSRSRSRSRERERERERTEGTEEDEEDEEEITGYGFMAGERTSIKCQKKKKRKEKKK